MKGAGVGTKGFTRWQHCHPVHFYGKARAFGQKYAPGTHVYVYSVPLLSRCNSRLERALRCSW